MQYGSERSLKSWEEVKTFLKELDSAWLFRGHADAAWGLQSTLDRHKGLLSASAAEEIIFRRFTRNAHGYLQAHHVPNETLEWLALMQHHGAPTRLLDWTTSPYVAAFFALEEVTDPTTTCAIWAIDGAWCRKQGAQIIREKRSVEIASAYTDGPTTWRPEHFDEVFRGKPLPVIMPVEPYRRNERLTIQSGTFLCPGDVDSGFEGNFEGYDSSVIDKHLVKIEMSASSRETALRDLKLMNITRATLFPGIDGFAQSLRHAPLLLESPALLAPRIKKTGAVPG